MQGIPGRLIENGLDTIRVVASRTRMQLFTATALENREIEGKDSTIVRSFEHFTRPELITDYDPS